MIIQCEHFQVELKGGTTFVLAGACGYRLTCLAGEIWITQHHLSSDWVLHCGEFITIQNPGNVVISACDERVIFSAQQRQNEYVKWGGKLGNWSREHLPPREKWVEA